MKREQDRAASAEDLIARLSSDLAPVRRSWPARIRLVIWLVAQAAVAVVMGLAFGLRPDLTARLHDGGYVAEISTLIVLSAGAAVLALLAGIPGREPRSGPTLAALVVATCALAFSYAIVPAAGNDVTLGWLCAVKTVAGALVPWIVLMIVLERSASVAPGLAGVLAGCACLAGAAAILRLTCPLDERWHLLLWHLAPIAAGSAASLLVAMILLSRWRRA